MLKRAALAFVLGLLALPAIASAAPAGVDIGEPRLAHPVDGRAALLVPVRYPIQLDGRAARAWVKVHLPGGASRTFRPHVRTSSGRFGAPETRRQFTFVHAIELSERLTRLLRGGRAAVSVAAQARIDVDRDGTDEIRRGDRRGRAVPARAGRLQCGTPPGLWARPGRRLSVALPRCGGAVRWRIARAPGRGRARIAGERLLYRSGERFRGTAAILLRGVPANRGSTARRSVPRPVEIKVGGAQGVVVRALGDSVTAGFGHYDDGTEMGIASLPSCKPAETFYNDACSSNSVSRSNAGREVEYAPDYGLANNVSWVAQWANAHGIANFRNYAVSGSEPASWLPGGQLAAATRKIVAEDPDYVLMTMGANPLLSEMLFGLDNMGCAIWSHVSGEYRECVERAFAEVNLRANLKALYEALLKTGATIYLMQYHLSVPSVALAYSATQIAQMGSLLNAQIASVAAEVDPRRLRVVTPPHFFVGIDISPVFPSRYSCSRFGFGVDGPSVQSTPSQDELLALHPLSFCSGPASGPPWVIGSDTGIHPSTTGYAQMASQVPAPVG